MEGAGKGKGMSLLIGIAKGRPRSSMDEEGGYSEEEGQEGGGDEMASAIAKDMLSAIDAKDESSLSRAIKMLMDSCKEGE